MVEIEVSSSISHPSVKFIKIYPADDQQFQPPISGSVVADHSPARPGTHRLKPIKPQPQYPHPHGGEIRASEAIESCGSNGENSTNRTIAESAQA